MTSISLHIDRRAIVASSRGWQSWTADAKDGPLPALLLTLTVVTGLVDAASILALGRVFVANMTGNIVFIAFGLAGAPGFSLRASLAGLAGFLIGASVGGWFNRRLAWDRVRLLAVAATVELALFAVTTAVLTVGSTGGSAATVGAVAVLAVGTGLQNAVVRRLAVADLTTTVLTMTLTGLAADRRTGQPGPTSRRRVLAVIAMLVGAFGGAILVHHDGAAPALLIATLLIAGVAAASAHHTCRRGQRHHSAPSPTAQSPHPSCAPEHQRREHAGAQDQSDSQPRRRASRSGRTDSAHVGG